MSNEVKNRVPKPVQDLKSSPSWQWEPTSALLLAGVLCW